MGVLAKLASARACAPGLAGLVGAVFVSEHTCADTEAGVPNAGARALRLESGMRIPSGRRHANCAGWESRMANNNEYTNTEGADNVGIGSRRRLRRRRMLWRAELCRAMPSDPPPNKLIKRETN